MRLALLVNLLIHGSMLSLRTFAEDICIFGQPKAKGGAATAAATPAEELKADGEAEEQAVAEEQMVNGAEPKVAGPSSD